MWQPSYMRSPAPAEIVGQWRRLAAGDVVNYLAGPIAEMRWMRRPRAKIQLGGEEMSWRYLGVDEPGPRTDFGWRGADSPGSCPGDEQDGFERAWLAAEEIVGAWWHETVAGPLAGTS